MNLYEQISYKGHHINVYYDEDALDPRQEFDHLGTLYTAHRHYQPEKDFHANFKINKVFEGRIGDFRDSFLKQYVALPVYLYEHGGATIATSPFSCPWDSGFFGIIAVSLERIRKLRKLAGSGLKHTCKGKSKSLIIITPGRFTATKSPWKMMIRRLWTVAGGSMVMTP